MKHTTKSASLGELACPHLRDYPTRQAKPTKPNTHAISVSFNSHPLCDLLATSYQPLATDLTQVLDFSRFLSISPSANTRVYRKYRILSLSLSFLRSSRW